MSDAPDLIAAFFTLAGDVSPFGGSLVSPHDLRDRAEAASQARYVGMGFVADDIYAAIERHGLPGVRAILSDNGIRYIELEAIVRWLADGQERADFDIKRKELLELAGELDVWNIKALGDFSGRIWPVETMADRFRGICAEAADATNAQVTIEIFPTTNIRDLQTATAVVEGAGAPNGGLLLDIWHMTRGGIAYEEFETIPSRWIKAIELNDAATELNGSLMEDSSDFRRFPGDGDFDIPGFLNHVKATGYTGPYGVEIASKQLRAMSLKDAAKRSYAATVAQFQSAEYLVRE